MALKPKHRRGIRDLLRVLYDDKAWQPLHTDRLLDIVRAARADVAEEVESEIARELAAVQRSTLAIQGELREQLRDVEGLREDLKGQHAKISALFEVLIDLPIAKAMVRGEDGTVVFDPTLISDKDAKVALSAAEKVLKVTGAMAPPKIDVEVVGGTAFEYFEAVEVEEGGE